MTANVRMISQPTIMPVSIPLISASRFLFLTVSPSSTHGRVSCGQRARIHRVMRFNSLNLNLLHSLTNSHGSVEGEVCCDAIAEEVEQRNRRHGNRALDGVV